MKRFKFRIPYRMQHLLFFAALVLCYLLITIPQGPSTLITYLAGVAGGLVWGRLFHKMDIEPKDKCKNDADVSRLVESAQDTFPQDMLEQLYHKGEL